MTRPSTPPAELFTIETSHEAPRLTRPRLSALGSVETEAERRRNHTARGTFAPGNRAGEGRGAKTALAGSLKDARRRARDALRSGVRPEDRDQVLADALKLYEAARRDLASSSMLVLGPALTFATQSALAGHLLNKAAAAGFHTKRGLALVETAHRCQGRAERAMTAALAAAKALGDSKKRRGPALTGEAVRDAAKPRGQS